MKEGKEEITIKGASSELVRLTNDEDELARVVIKNYPSKVLIAKNIRPILYVNKKSKVKGKKDIPKSFLSNPEKYYFDTKGVLINRITGEPQLANPKLANTPRYWVVNFQDVWNQTIIRQSRALRVDKLKNIIRPYLKDIVIMEFPIEFSINIFDTSMPIDVFNKGAIYIKSIEDLLTELNIIPDDSPEYINCSGRIKYINVKSEDDIKMEIVLSKSNCIPI